MPKDRYFLSNEDFTEPFGQVIPKGSILKYSEKRKEPETLYVLYFDEEEKSVYPIIFIKSKLTKINTTDIEKSTRKMFDEYENRKPEKTLAEMFPNKEDREKYILERIEIFNNKMKK